MEGQWVWVQCCCNTTTQAKTTHTIECMRNGPKKRRLLWGTTGNTHKRHGVSTGKPVALVGDKKD